MTIQNVVDFTNEKLIEWYELAKQECGVIGNGKARYDEDINEIIIDYTEDGINEVWSISFYESYLSNGISWVYECWQELA